MSANEEADIRNFDSLRAAVKIGESNRERRSVFNRAFSGILQLFAPFM